VGALEPVAITLSFGVGDRLLAFLLVLGALVYFVGRRLARA